MSTDYRCRAHVLWITLQLLIFAHIGPHFAMAIAHFTPYVSEFEYASRFHPSKNPDCPTSGWADNAERHFVSRRYRRSPEEGPPVGQEPSIEVRAILVRCPKTAEETAYSLEKKSGSRFVTIRAAQSVCSRRVNRLEENRSCDLLILKKLCLADGAPSVNLKVKCYTFAPVRSELYRDDVLINRNVYNITAGRSQDILDFHGFDRDEQAHHSEVRDCRRKLIITMKFNNIGRTKTQEEFVVIDHVLDPVTMHKARLLNPFVVKVRQEPVLQLYGLKFQGVVNAEAREEVINKKLSNYTGCDDTSDNPTCGQMIFEGKPIPYSQGFCCSCDPELNVQRQASLLNETVVSSFPSFFTKSKNTPIRPFKSPRSVNANLDDSFSDVEEIEDPASSNVATREDTPRSSYQSHENSKNPKFDHDFVDIADKNSTIDGPRDDERDLINLKYTSKMKKENRGRPSWKSIFDDANDKNTALPHVAFVPPGSLRRRSNSSGSIDKGRDTSLRQKSFDSHSRNDIMAEFRPSVKQMSFDNEPATSSYASSYHNLRNVDLAEELTKLEEDYKNYRLSSIMRAEERIKEAKDKLPIYNLVGNTSNQRSNYNEAKNFIEQPEKEFGTKIHQGYQDHSSETASKVPLLKNNFYESGSTLSIDIKLAVRPKVKSTTGPLTFIDESTKRLAPVTTPSSSSPETETPAVLRQKLVSDRVYPSKGRSNVSGINFYSMDVTTELSQKINSDVADLLANAVMSDNDKDSSNNFQRTNDDYPTHEETYSATSFVNSFTESSFRFEGTATNLPETKYPEASIDNSSNRAEILTDSRTSLSSGNLSYDDAIPLSGSLKNQLANWFTDDMRNNSELESSRKNLKEHLGQYSEVGYNAEVGEFEETIVPTADDNLAKGHIRHEDSSTTIGYRKPVEVHLGSDQEYSLVDRKDEKIPQKTWQRHEEALRKVFPDYSSPEPMEFESNKKSRDRSVPRSYRSIAEDDSFFVKDNDRQRTIDRQIEDEFEEISDALKEAADGPKVVREKPKSDAIFEQDNSIVRKFATMFDKNPKPMRHDNQMSINNRLASLEENPEVQTAISKHTEAEPVSEILPTTGPEVVVDKFRLINDFQMIPIGPEKPVQEIASSDLTVPNVPLKARDRKQEESLSTAPPESTTIMKNEPSIDPVSEVLQTTDHRIIVDRLKPVNDVKEITNKEPLQEKILPDPSFTEIASTIGDLDHDRESATRVPSDSISIAKSKDALAINKDTYFRSVLSPVLMIENLKNELLKEVERYSSVSPSRSTAGKSDFKESRKHPSLVDSVRQVNTELTPAERIEDSITDEETLPPDEETKYTTDAMSKTPHLPTSNVYETSSIESSTGNETIFPGLGIENFDAKFVNTNRALPLKRANKLLILVEEPSPSSSARSTRHGNKRNYKKRLRRRNRRNNRHKRRSIKAKSNIGASPTIVSIVKGRSENEDDEHPWYDATTKSVTTIAKDRSNDVTKIPVTGTTLSNMSLQNRKRRFDIEKLLDSRSTGENNERSGESSNEVKPVTGKLYVSITRIPENDYHANVAGLRIEEIPKIVQKETALRSNLNEAKGSLLKWPENSEEVDEMPIFRDTKNLNLDSASGRSKRNLQKLLGKFRDNVNSVDAAAGREEIGRNNKRNELIDSNESQPEALIFYDYEDSEAKSAASENDENDRSLDDLASKELHSVSRKKNLRATSDKTYDPSAKSSAVMSRNLDRRTSVKRKSSMSRNHRLYSRSDTNGVAKNADPFRKDIATVSSASLGVKEPSEENCSDNQLGIEPSDGWREKMELLKLKKHADVLKEYLNWRQDVAPPEAPGIPGYTTRISLTNVREEQTTDLFTTDNFPVSDETTLPASTSPTDSAVTNESASSEEQRTEVTDTTTSNDEHYLTNVTTTFGSSETSAFLQSNNRSANCSDVSPMTTVKVETSTTCPDNKTEESFRYNDEASTGRILPPCGYQNGLTTCHAKHESITQSTSVTSPKVIPDHQSQLSDIDRDLIIISVIEKNRLKNKNQFHATNQDGASAKVHRIHDNVESAPILQHRRRHKSKNHKIQAVRKSKKIRHKTRAGRQLMSLDESDERNNDEGYDLTLEDNNENNYMDLPNEEDAFNGDEHDSEMWNKKWSQMIDKIINENASNSWRSGNASTLSLKEIPGDSRSAMQQLHFDNADKYIRQIAKKIVHNTNIHEPKHRRGKFIGESEAKVRKASRHHRPATRQAVPRRKLQSYPIARRKVIRATENGEDFGNYEGKRSASRVVSKTDDSSDDQRDSSALHSSNPGPRSADANASTSRETSEQDKAGRDFAISLSGKIHVEGGTNGQPMSISFDTSPEIQSSNETERINSNGTSKFDNATKTDGETAPSTNFLSSLFNIASVPKDLTHHSPDENKNLSASPTIRQSVRDVGGEKLRYSRENHRRKSSGSARKYPGIRKSRAVNEEIPQRIFRYRDGRSYDVRGSQDLDDIDEEESEFEDYPEESMDDNYSDLTEYEDTPVVSADRRSLNTGNSCPEIDGAPALEDRSLNRPEVKVIKIIPLDGPKSFASAAATNFKHEDTKSSRMTASQLPKMEDDNVPGTTVKPGKIRPAALPWRENEDEENPMLDTMEDNFPPKSSGSCPSQSESSDGNPENAEPSNDLSVDRRISTSNPVSLKVIGLISMNQPSNKLNGDSNLNSDANYEIVPLVHVKIEQQSENRGDDPAGPMEAGCPAIEMSKPSQHFHDDQSSCSKCNDGSNMQGEDSTRRPQVATLNMDNDEELREPIQIGSCPGSNRKDSEILTDHSNDNKLDSTPTTEVRPCAGNQEITTTPKTRLEEAPNRSDSRKKIRLKNMLAIMRFMKKIKELMNGEEAPELSENNNKDIVVKLERVDLPNNQSNETPKKIEQTEESTDRVVMIGEGVRHKPSANGINFEKNFRLSGTQESDEAIGSPNSGDKFNEMESGNKSSKANLKGVEKDRDKSFLFHGENAKSGTLNRSAIGDSNQRESASIDRANDDADHPKEEEASDEVHRHKIRLIEKLKNAQNIVNPIVNEENLSSESGGENLSNPSADDNDPESNGKATLRNFERKFSDRLRGMRDRERNENEQGDVTNDLALKERKTADNDFSLIPKTKRHRTPLRLRADRMRYERRNERDAKRQIYRRTSLPTGREVSRLSNGKFERYAAAKGIPKEKRKTKKKKKKKKRRRKKKKKRKKKKGKSHREAAIKGKAWWPFGRQLMSVSEELISESNFARSQVERVGTKRHGNRRLSLPFESRRRRRVHRAKYPHKSKKKRRKHKKPKRKKHKKKKKSKGREQKKTGLRNKRQIRPGGTQVRGGQDCMDRRHPPGVNPAKYLESAHCLRFSDMWYSVYELENPIMEHTVYLQLFEKHSLEDGTTHWDDLTQGTMVRMGTFTRHQKDSKPTIVFTYSGAKTESQKRALNLDPAKQRLLVPSPVPPKKSSQYPEAKGGLGEYLVVQTNAISKDGKDCDKAGVGFAAFSKQEDRCGRAKDSCLRNQPLAYWRHDTEARESGRPGCYFLSNFATVPTNPIKYNVSGSGSREYLGLEYHSAHVSAIDIEVRTDYNAIVRVGSSGRVTEVYVDSTALEHTVVTVVISNMGLASSPYQPRITDCPTGLPVSWSKAKGIMQVIPPQHDQRVTLDLYGQLLINGFHCSVEVVNHRGELVAMRRIRVQKMDRCFCVWHCLCACIGSVSGMGCQPMSPEHYHAAGFQGPVPVVTTETSILMNAVKDVLMLSALLVLLLLFLGILKWFLGTFVPAVGRWGLDTLLDGSRIEKYFEPELKCRCVVTDEDGSPVHPDTGQRTVRICSRKLEFLLNLIFFLTYPIAICCSYFRRSLNESRQRNCCPDESKMCLINEKGSCPKMICVSTYGDSRNSKLEAEDTRYVMNELKKSQESLDNPKRTKKKDGRGNGPGKNLPKKSSRKDKSSSDVRAKRFVDDLLRRRMVFRNLTEPIGGVSIPAGIAYSLRGYFLNAEDGGYRFITPCPFKQHWLIVNNEKKASKPPEIYPSNHFMRSFGTARDVYESNELSLTPRGICINVQYHEDR